MVFFVDGEVKNNDGSGLVAIKSKIGSLVSGPVVQLLCLQNFPEAEAQLNVEVKKFWDLDSAGIRDDEITVCEKHGEVEFKKGRHEVGLLLKESYPAVEDNFDQCCNRLWKLKERLDKKPEHLKQYNDIIQDQLNQEAFEVVDEEPSDEECSEDGMKFRIVYNASAKGKNGVSLNYCLYKGPNMSPMLYDLFLNFKTQPIAITADIAKAYLQISVKEHHRNLLRFYGLIIPLKNHPV